MRTLLVAVVLMASRPVLSQTCSLPPGLYAEEARLEERYDKEVGNDYVRNKAVADEILQRQRAVDQKYLKYMSRVANSTAEALSSCCPSSQQDPVALRVCALSSYMKGERNDVASFLASVPADKASAHSLWLLDEIVHSQGPGVDESKLPFHPSGPVSTYISELYKLVAAGNQNAIRKYLHLFELAIGTTGDAGEEMEDNLEKLLVRKPALVAENWRIFREYPKALMNVDEMMSEGEKRQAVSSILSGCAAKNLNCDGLSSALK
jgi:hypothetical protein